MTTIYNLGNTQIDISERSIVIAGEIFSIEPKANTLLKLLMDNAHQVVSRDEILEHVFPGQVVSYSSINRLVAILRKVFNHDPATPEYIKTIAKVGYKLQVSVNPLSTTITTTEPLEQSKQEEPLAQLSIFSPLSKTKKWLIIAITFAIIVTSLVFTFLPKYYFSDQVSCAELPDWILSGSNTIDYIGCLDKNVGRPAPSAYITNKISSPDGFTSLLQGGWLAEYRGKKIRLSIQIKANNVIDYAGLFLRADNSSSSESLAFINSGIAGDQIINSLEWTEKSLILDIPHATENLVYGVYLNGAGEIWLDNVEFEILGEAEPNIPSQPSNPSPTNLNFESTKNN